MNLLPFLAAVVFFASAFQPGLAQERISIRGKCLAYGQSLPSELTVHPLDPQTRNWLDEQFRGEMPLQSIRVAQVPFPVAVQASGGRIFLLYPQAAQGNPTVYLGALLHGLAHVNLNHLLDGRESEEWEADQWMGGLMGYMRLSQSEAAELAQQAIGRGLAERPGPYDPDRRMTEIMSAWEEQYRPPAAATPEKGNDDRAEELPPSSPPRNGGGKISIPSFPLPPPKPSASYVLPSAYLTSAATLGQADQLLARAVAACGYIEKSYFAVPRGFAMATLMEQIDPNTAEPLPPPDRWDQEVGELESFSLKQYLQALIFGHTGSFRVFVFVVTPVAFTSSGRPATREEAETWLSEGLNKLPVRMRRMPFTEDHRCTVLIYEFEKKEGEEPRFVERSRFSSRTHLERARILEALTRP